jgi:hypothetical protein
MFGLIRSAKICVALGALFVASCLSGLAVAGDPPGDDARSPLRESRLHAVMPRIESKASEDGSTIHDSRSTTETGSSRCPLVLERPAVWHPVRVDVVVGGCTDPNCQPQRVLGGSVVLGSCGGAGRPPCSGGGYVRLGGCGSSGCRPSCGGGGCSGAGCIRIGGGCGGGCR